MPPFIRSHTRQSVGRDSRQFSRCEAAGLLNLLKHRTGSRVTDSGLRGAITFTVATGYEPTTTGAECTAQSTVVKRTQRKFFSESQNTITTSSEFSHRIGYSASHQSESNAGTRSAATAQQ